MLAKILIEIYERDLAKLKTEIAAYSNEPNLWKIDGSILNSAGNLTLHICGNLQHFIGAVLGNSGYVRDRDLEFSRKHVPIAELLEEIDVTRDVVIKTLNNLDEGVFDQTYPVEVFGKPMTTGFFLVHLATHLNWHLGHINYHRRLLGAAGHI